MRNAFLARSVAWLVLVVATATGCSDPTVGAPPGASVGTLQGTVTLLGTDGSPNLIGIRVSLFASLADYESRRAAYNAPVTLVEGTARTFAFTFGHVAPGDYYIVACFNFGCGDYRDGDSGTLKPVHIDRARVTSVRMQL